MIPYSEFLKTKTIKAPAAGIAPSVIAGHLFDWQAEIVKRACQFGRGAIFADCGLGKTPMQLEWASKVLNKYGGRVLIVAPLAVAEQTQKEGAKFGTEVTVCRSGDDLAGGINITNYEMLHHFSPKDFQGIVLDESSILKNYSGKLRGLITDFGREIPYRLCCTATPAPNDIMEIGTHCEFLGRMTRAEMLATFFVHDSGDTQKWRLKGHALRPFYEWMSSWAIALRKPSDIGFTDDRFKLSPLSINETVVKSESSSGYLFAMEAATLSERRDARRESLKKRVDAVAEKVSTSRDPWVVWCDLNSESEALAKIIPGAVEVRGSHSYEEKKSALAGFSDGSIRVLVTKPSIAGFGLNWQHCADMAFTGLSDSYEQFYQAVRRCWRFGQTRQVNVDVVISEREGAVLRNIQRKEKQAEELYDQLVSHMNLNRRSL